MKLVPLSLYMTFGSPLRLVNLRIADKHASLERSETISKLLPSLQSRRTVPRMLSGHLLDHVELLVALRSPIQYE